MISPLKSAMLTTLAIMLRGNILKVGGGGLSNVKNSGGFDRARGSSL